MFHEMARPWAMVGITLVGLAACTSASGVRIGVSDISQNYRPEELGIFSGGDREVRVDVTNNPFPNVPQETFDELIVDLMPGDALRYPVNFSLDPAVEYRPERNIRVLMVFDPPKSLPSIGLCRQSNIDAVAARPVDLPADPGRVRVLGAYCQGELTVTRATGTVPRGPDLASTNLDALVSQMTLTMFPFDNPSLREDDCPPFLVRC